MSWQHPPVRVLVVEDEVRLAAAIASGLTAEGYDVDETYRRIAADQQRADTLGIRLGKPEQQPAQQPESPAQDDEEKNKPSDKEDEGNQ